MRKMGISESPKEKRTGQTADEQKKMVPTPSRHASMLK
jgi:hypothetical protein